MTSPISSTTSGTAQRINLRRVKLSHCDRRRALLIRRRFEQAVSAQALVGRRQAVRQRFLVPSSLVRIQAPQPRSHGPFSIHWLSDRNSFKRDARPAWSFVSHSQITNTVQPSASSLDWLTSSLLTLSSNFCCQYSACALGVVARAHPE